MATRPISPSLPAAARPRRSICGSSLTLMTGTAKPRNRLYARPTSPSRRSADLAGRAVTISTDIPAIFDAPLPPHHKLIGRWVATRATSSGLYPRPAARRHLEGVFTAAVLEILDPIEIAEDRKSTRLNSSH